MNIINTAFLIMILSLPMQAIASEQAALPEDVAQFVEERDLCDHFRGEEPYDEERREFLNRNMNELCTGTDKKLAELRDKYMNDAVIIKALSVYEDDIEPNQ